ncbi:hypothetical protein GGI25_005157 [Coemansia spiralis]|uniref:PCI domain-containing protein n=2 Tax=Coemansia TaxID=4863 RepID=A0A9W8KWR3_9FUNG|nr:putative COP9 signalosome complex subunit [Coemansia spiralis]KAJ1988798.1 hypothetical protein EDC05_005089 [Coemansia umbellata]KAJ2620052.1 hypothetical protein GGI26_005346 [Coemansia sp. RSA 1358]KAJ2672395.1 hypothetical protein GGI25_005157 [Coemansia spiralis]
MSDDDFMYDDDADDFMYEEDDGNEEDLGIENKYYNAKALRDDFGAAMREFQAVISEDKDGDGPSEWGFKATKQIIKLSLRNRKLDDMLVYYGKMLDFVLNSVVPRNYAEKSINNMLERVSINTNSEFTYRFYIKTLDALRQTQNDRLRLRTSLRLARLLLDQRKHKELVALLSELKSECQDAQGDPLPERGTQLLEINAMYLEMYEARNEIRKLKDIYLECAGIKSAIPHPRVMGFIKECGGRMFMNERNWVEAQSSFFDAFKNYDEAGSPQRVRVLKYLVLASMLCENEVSPLSSPEAKAYENDPAIMAMTDMVKAYENQDVVEFERVLCANKEEIQDDPFIKDFIEDLRRTFRMQALEATVLPYTCIYISSLAKLLKATAEETEELLFALILDGRLNASIDQERGLVVLQQGTSDRSQYEAISQWATNIENLMRTSCSLIN